MASENTFDHWKVVFSWGKMRKSRFSQNPLNPQFWAFGFSMYTSSSANFKKDPPWYIFSLSVHAPATSDKVLQNKSNLEGNGWLPYQLRYVWKAIFRVMCVDKLVLDNLDRHLWAGHHGHQDMCCRTSWNSDEDFVTKPGCLPQQQDGGGEISSEWYRDHWGVSN